MSRGGGKCLGRTGKSLGGGKCIRCGKSIWSGKCLVFSGWKVYNGDKKIGCNLDSQSVATPV